MQLNRVIRKTLTVAGLGLLAFHGWLFAGQAWDGQLTDIALAVRWLIGGGLVFGLVTLRRQRASMFWGRRAVALWLLAGLLHGPALAERLGGVTHAPALPGVVAVLAPVSAAAVAGATLLLLLALLFGVRRRAVQFSGRCLAQDAAAFYVRSSLSHSLHAPRPPPIA
jgi:hypothetical protein